MVTWLSSFDAKHLCCVVEEKQNAFATTLEMKERHTFVDSSMALSS